MAKMTLTAMTMALTKITNKTKKNMKTTKITQTIDFTDSLTTREALACSVKYTTAFFRCAWRDMNSFAHQWPWVLVGLSLTASLAASYVCISSARAERDAASRRVVTLQQQAEQLSCALEARKEAAR